MQKIGKFPTSASVTSLQNVTALTSLQREVQLKNEDLEDFFENSAIGLHIVSGEGIIQRANKAELALLGYTAEEYVGRHIAEFHADAPIIGDILQRLSCGERLDQYPARLRAKDGSIKHVLITSNSRFEDGRFVNTRCFTMDVTESQRMEDRLRRSEQHMRDLLEALPIAVYTTDPRGRITFFNKACIAMAGRTPQLGEEWCVTWRLYTTDGSPLPHSDCPMAVALKEDRPVRGEEAIAERPDGTFVPFIPYPTPLHDAEGKLIGAINMLVDITERKAAENRQKVLIDELNHRVKNTLAMVQSLAAQTARHTTTTEAFVETFEKRLMALARAHDLLTIRHWRDAPFQKLVHDVVEPLTGDIAGRVRLEGPRVEVDARTALAFTLTLNELATNATKYGSLSAPGGTLLVSWSVRNNDGTPALEFHWREHGGPVVQAPKRRGFGSRLMERCIESDLAGDFDLAFEADGVRCRISVPLRDTHDHESAGSRRIATGHL